jgi:hypothetical protein
MYYDQYNRIDPSHEASYGDWGTSKTYVRIGLGISGYSSFSLIAAICLLTALVGVNYICRHYPRTGRLRERSASFRDPFHRRRLSLDRWAAITAL